MEWHRSLGSLVTAVVALFRSEGGKKGKVGVCEQLKGLLLRGAGGGGGGFWLLGAATVAAFGTAAWQGRAGEAQKFWRVAAAAARGGGRGYARRAADRRTPPLHKHPPPPE